MIDWVRRINLLLAFILLFAFHGLLYYSLGTASWFMVTLMATTVDTAILAVIQFVLTSKRKQKGN